jgi:hypothetical protein
MKNYKTIKLDLLLNWTIQVFTDIFLVPRKMVVMNLPCVFLKIMIYWDAKFKTIVDVIGEKYFESYNKAESFVFLKELEVEIPENNV